MRYVWLILTIFMLFLFNPYTTISQGYEFNHLGITVTKGQFRPGLRNLEAQLAFVNDYTAIHNISVKPYNYNNDFLAWGIGSGGLITSANIGYYAELYWNHHRDIFVSEVDGLLPDENPLNNKVIEVKRRLNYTTLGIGFVFFRIALMGFGLDFGKLSLKQREYGVQDTAKPIFTDLLGGSDLTSPGGRFTAINIFGGALLVMSPILLQARIYYQKQFLGTSFEQGYNSYYFDTSNWGFKFIIGFGLKRKKS